MAKYAKCALEAVNLIIASDAPPGDAWRKATTQAFGAGTSGQEKSCPRDAFLGLCQQGLVRGVPGGRYTASKKSAGYAVSAAAILRNRPELADRPIDLWNTVVRNQPKAHNQQMNVVIALWKANLLKR